MSRTRVEQRPAEPDRPRWWTVLLQPSRIATLAFVLAVAVTCVLLGRWQLSRLAERRALNEALESRIDLPAMDLADLQGELERGTPPEQLEFRRIVLEGRFAAEEEVLQRNRSHEGRQGFHVVTPLIVSEDLAVLIRRGWVPAALDDPPINEAEPPRRPATVTGLLRAPERHTGFGPQDPATGVLERVFWVDPQRLDRQTTRTLLDVVVDLRTVVPQNSRDLDLPEPLPDPSFDEANHLSYAIQWFSFAVIAVVGIGFYARSQWFRDSTP
ncbi:MAG TPA: SURF1 family protein [Nitriliruptorales bacterium]